VKGINISPELPSGGAANYYVGGLSNLSNITDGMSNTILFTEELVLSNTFPFTWCYNTWTWQGFQWPIVGWWNSPPNAMFYPGLTQAQVALAQQNSAELTSSGSNWGDNYIYEQQASSAHPGVVMAVLGDGSVRALTQGMSQYTYNLALIPNDGLVLGRDW
jgi:hypothetical protein